MLKITIRNLSEFHSSFSKFKVYFYLFLLTYLLALKRRTYIFRKLRLLEWKYTTAVQHIYTVVVNQYSKNADWVIYMYDMIFLLDIH